VIAASQRRIVIRPLRALEREPFNLTEESTMSMKNESREDAVIIANAVRELQTNPELHAEAERNVDGAMDKLGLKGFARHAVASAFALALAGGVTVAPNGYWGG
jgi:hypothetical protein